MHTVQSAKHSNPRQNKMTETPKVVMVTWLPWQQELNLCSQAFWIVNESSRDDERSHPHVGEGGTTCIHVGWGDGREEMDHCSWVNTSGRGSSSQYMNSLIGQHVQSQYTVTPPPPPPGQGHQGVRCCAHAGLV